MNEIKVTVIITPRDRYSGIIECIKQLYLLTPEPFFLKILDLGYPKALKREISKLITSHDNANVYDYGKIIPMAAIKKVRKEITTPYTVLIDNDSRVTPGWLHPLIATAEKEHAGIINPVTLEKEGVDKGAELRNHLFTNEIKVVNVDNIDYLIEEKHFRRELPEKLPNDVRQSEMFELHGVLFETNVLLQVDIPDMVIREHIDIALQVRKMKRPILTQPKSIIVFDNLGTRMKYYDMVWFFFRWNTKNTEHASRLFEQRWKFNFYSEQSIYHWVFRRKVFLICRWFYFSIPLSNNITRIFSKVKTTFKPLWDPIQDPNSTAVNFYQNRDFD